MYARAPSLYARTGRAGDDVRQAVPEGILLQDVLPQEGPHCTAALPLPLAPLIFRTVYTSLLYYNLDSIPLKSVLNS